MKALKKQMVGLWVVLIFPNPVWAGGSCFNLEEFVATKNKEGRDLRATTLDIQGLDQIHSCDRVSIIGYRMRKTPTLGSDNDSLPNELKNVKQTGCEKVTLEFNSKVYGNHKISYRILPTGPNSWTYQPEDQGEGLDVSGIPRNLGTPIEIKVVDENRIEFTALRIANLDQGTKAGTFHYYRHVFEISFDRGGSSVPSNRVPISMSFIQLMLRDLQDQGAGAGCNVVTPVGFSLTSKVYEAIPSGGRVGGRVRILPVPEAGAQSFGTRSSRNL